jgi:opacity protein-like surface antigen
MRAGIFSPAQPRPGDRENMKPVQSLAWWIAALIGLASGAAAGAEPVKPASPFYGGITIRDQGAEQGVSLGRAGDWARFTPTLTDARSSQTVMFGGYRWRDDVAFEASLVGIESYRLSGGRGGVGLVAPALADDARRTWNLDVYANWGLWRSLSLYGRLGYSQTENLPVYSTSVAGADRRYRDGLNYGVGLRYDLTRTLGLKLEYARVPAHLGDASLLALPEGDQLQFGLQFRF